MKKVLFSLVALSALASTAYAGRADYPTWSDIRPAMTEQMSYNTKALAVPMLIKAKVKFSESNDVNGKAR